MLPPLCITCRSSPVPDDAKRLVVAFHAVGPLHLLHTPPPPHRTCQHREHDPLGQPVVMRVIDITFKRLLVLTVVSTLLHRVLASRSESEQQDPVVNRAEFVVVVLVSGPRPAPV